MRPESKSKNDNTKVIPIDINSNSMVKGEIREGLNLVSWDAIQKCNKEICPIGDECLVAPVLANRPCAVQTQYLQSFIDTVFLTYRGLDESDAYKVGMHLVPMYSSLCRLKILEKSLENVGYFDRHGNPAIHPIYKEIRDTMKTISLLWKDIGIKGGPVGFNDGTIAPGQANRGFGDPTHYDAISRGADNKKNVTR